MCNLIVMTFDDHEDTSHIQDILRQLQENSHLTFDATVITKSREGILQANPMKVADDTGTSRAGRALEELAEERAFVQNVPRSLPHGSAALFMVLSEGDAVSALMSMLLLFAPNATPMLLPASMMHVKEAGADFRAELETYQAAVANLEQLRADSSEMDVDMFFRAVDDAYNHLVHFIQVGKSAIETEK